VNWMLEDKLQTIVPNIRFQIQLHKVIWSPETRGV
ncbi:MAG TPA: radical SAM protein, partial [bacterium]|nr:radical SAM protein [bacterium]